MSGYPDEKTVEEVAGFDICNSRSERVKFGSLFEKQKTVVVFIRHFFCGICQAFVEDLAAVPNENLVQAGTRIVVIGCGEPEVISLYAEKTKFNGEIYADPSRKLYHALGMTIETLKKTPAGQNKKSYVPASAIGNALESAWSLLRNGHFIGKQGNFKQLGGDFVFGPGNICTFAHVMQHTEDHVEIADLLKAAGVSALS